MATDDQHEPGWCFCRGCRTCARLAAPTLYGFIGKRPGSVSHPSIHTWCPWCATWHDHGDHTNQPGDVLHRFPHCAGEGPYKRTGYLIAVTNIPLAKVWGKLRRSTPEQRQKIAHGETTPAIDRLRSQVLPLLKAEHHGGEAWT